MIPLHISILWGLAWKPLYFTLCTTSEPVWRERLSTALLPWNEKSSRTRTWYGWIHTETDPTAANLAGTCGNIAAIVLYAARQLNQQQLLFVPKCSHEQNPSDKEPLKVSKKPDFIRNQASNGAARQIRTADLILTKDALYLLSYSSMWRFFNLQHYGDPERARTVDL